MLLPHLMTIMNSYHILNHVSVGATYCISRSEVADSRATSSDRMCLNLSSLCV